MARDNNNISLAVPDCLFASVSVSVPVLAVVAVVAGLLQLAIYIACLLIRLAREKPFLYVFQLFKAPQRRVR